jgi:hypothetical protein
MSSDDEGHVWLQFDTGDDPGLMLVPVQPDPSAPCFCRWHRAVWLARRAWAFLLVHVLWKVQEVLCGIRGHRLTAESRDIYGENLTLYCWCAKRYRYIGEEGE